MNFLLPLAIQCEMPLDLFWYDDEEYLKLYVQAYYEKVKLQAWMNGQLNYVAYSAIVSQMFGKKAEYISYDELTNQSKKEDKYTEEEARDIISSCY